MIKYYLYYQFTKTAAFMKKQYKHCISVAQGVCYCKSRLTLHKDVYILG